MNILYIEDDPIIASGLIYSLEQDGYNVFHHTDSQNIASIIADTDFSLAILDIMLPDGDGFDICNEIRKKDNNR